MPNITVELLRGRTLEQRRAFALAVADSAVEILGARRQDVRMVVGVTRAGATYCALRLRAHDDDQSVVGGADLVPELITLLGATLEPMDDVEDGT